MNKAFYICLIGGMILVILGAIVSKWRYEWCENLPINEYYEKCYRK